MATTIYKKVNFVDRLDNKPNIYLVDGKETKIVKDDSGVVTHGTNLDQENLNHVEDGILQNSRDISMLDKTLEKNVEETTKSITDIIEVDKKQDDAIKQIQYTTKPTLIKREAKDPDTGLFTTVVLRDVDTKNRVVFSNLHAKVGDNFTKQTVNIYNDKDQQVAQYRYELIYDADGDFIERRLL
ncbi:hypothetical protein RSJ21_00305 (plasmid) [Clostridium botulinum]|uniref:hypothetical protein n=1 Tax=Clostridium botulinum TaxID=1491 RepID=UPI000C77448B|nr:hypothetical protein [Clostridium botulinum]AUN23778.1 hypothetical protein RSJ21_00305 [Clostridium botulinum]